MTNYYTINSAISFNHMTYIMADIPFSYLLLLVASVNNDRYHSPTRNCFVNPTPSDRDIDICTGTKLKTSNGHAPWGQRV